VSEVAEDEDVEDAENDEENDEDAGGFGGGRVAADKTCIVS
jgi:hypothetical protein